MKIAIVGAGFSGLLAGYLLNKKGHQVTVYEKNFILGGHCYTLNQGLNFLDLGTDFTFASPMKTLLKELHIEYSERSVYKDFIDHSFNKVEFLSFVEISKLVKELSSLETILSQYAPFLNTVVYDYIHNDLKVSLYEFFKKHDLNILAQLVSLHLSSFGLGNSHEIAAYYALNIFTQSTIQSFIKGDKLIFIDRGFSEIIQKLALQLKDIRLNTNVEKIVEKNGKVQVTTSLSTDEFDQVLVTALVPPKTFIDSTYHQFMSSLVTNSYVSAAFDVSGNKIVTSYFKENTGKNNTLQFFHTTNVSNNTSLVAYAYGHLNKTLIDNIKQDLENIGIRVNHLIAARQWEVFPHLAINDMSEFTYTNLNAYQKTSNIKFIGSLVSKPSISNLYEAIQKQISEIPQNNCL